MRTPLALIILLAFAHPQKPNPGASSDPWQMVTAAISESQKDFPSGLCVEIMTPAGVVYSRPFGGFSNTRWTPVASASKWVSATVFLRMVEAGVLSLDTQAKSLLVDRTGKPWSGNMGEIRLRHLLSFTAGIRSDVASSTDRTISLEESVLRIYENQSPTAAPPGSSFTYGGLTDMRIAARMAEKTTGLSWRELYDTYFRVPMGWAEASTFVGAGNPNLAGGLLCTGLEYTRFLMMQFRQGVDGNTRFLKAETIAMQNADAFGPSTTIAYSAYTFLGKAYHYGLGHWVESPNGGAPSPTNPPNRISSTGKFGWAPWIPTDGKYAAVIMTRQVDAATSFVPSELLKAKLDPLIRQALSMNVPVIRTVP